MNKSTSNFIKEQIKAGLQQVNDAQLHFFKRMYSRENLNASIDEVVESMPDEKLENALAQIENTLSK